MNVLVTGASGFIGSALMPFLLGRGHAVRALARRAAQPPHPAAVEWLVGDIRDPACLERATHGMDAVVHLACATGVAHEAVARAVNVEGTRLLLAAARADGVRRVVFVSSISAARRRMGPYGRTKREAEALVSGSGLEWVILRPSLVYGSDDDAGLFARLASALRSLPVFPVMGDGRMALDPVHVDDLCAVIEQCLSRPDVVGKRYDVLGPDRVEFDELLRRMAAELGVTARLLHVPGAIALPLARMLGRLMERPPISEDNVLGMISPAETDAAAARRDFPISWTPLDVGLRRLRKAA